MERLFHLIAEHWHLSPAQYWHLRIISAVSVVPLLAILYLVLFGRKRGEEEHVPQPTPRLPRKPLVATRHWRAVE